LIFLLLLALPLTWLLSDRLMRRVIGRYVPFGVNLLFAAILQISQVILYFGFFFMYLGGRIRVKTYLPGDLDLTYDDYVGNDEIKERAKTLVAALKGADIYRKLKGKFVSGLLLTGRPGSGKTYLMKVVASEAGIPVICVEASSLLGTFVGIGPLKVSMLFRKARKLSKIWGGAILFIDEIDAIGGTRRREGASFSFWGGIVGGQILNTFLSCLSGLNEPAGRIYRMKRRIWRCFGLTYNEEVPNLLVVGATNTPEVLDPALIRPGRLGDRIEVPLPHHQGVVELIRYYLKGVPQDGSCIPEEMAKNAVGQTPAAIEVAIDKMKIYAAQEGRDYITVSDWRRAMSEASLGLRQPLPMSERDRLQVATHEAGHAVVCLAIAPNQRVAYATIYRYGPTFGHISHYPIVQHYISSKSDIETSIMISMGGMAAEEVFLRERYNTVGGDMPAIMKGIYLMVWGGMLGRPTMLPPNVYLTPFFPQEAKFSEELKGIVDKYYNERYAEVKEILKENEEAHRILREALMRKNELGADEILELVGGIIKRREIKCIKSDLS
jgi:cell division protease FtsH